MTKLQIIVFDLKIRSRVKNLALTWLKRLKQQSKESGGNLNARWEDWV